MVNNLLKSILDDEFLGTLAKSADLYKIGSNSVLDPQEIKIGLKVVPRAVMAMLISELSPMEINSSKDIKLPFGTDARMSVNKNSADNYTGSVYDDNKLVYDFMNRSIPGLGVILLSTFELYDLEELNKPHEEIRSNDDIDKRVQKLIDERMELHSLVSKVVEEKMAQREAIHKLMMGKLNEVLSAPTPPVPPMPISKPLEIKPADVIKKESVKKELPLKKFLDRKKKATEYSVKMEKSDTVDCDSCGQVIFGNSAFSSCLCFGENMGSKIWIKKTEDGIQLKFSRSWTPDNIEMLLETLRARK